LGIRQVDIGQYLAAGTMMVTIQSLDPIFADLLPAAASCRAAEGLGRP